jgi:S1-C subfamily serine protease
MGEGIAGASEEAPFRGWVPPEDRLWRHPSELSGTSSSAAAGGSSLLGDPRLGDPTLGDPRLYAGRGAASNRTVLAASGKRRAAAMAFVGSGAAAAVFAGVVLLNSTGRSNPANSGAGAVATTIALATSTSSALPAALQRVAQGIVSLTVTTSHGTERASGVVVASGGMVVTTANALSGSTAVQALTVLGSRRAKVVAVDHGSNVALLDVGSDIPVPRFVNDAAVGTGQGAMVVAAQETGSHAAAVAWAPVTIASVGTSVKTAGADKVAAKEADSDSMAAIGVSTDGIGSEAGEVLVARNGGVIGILEQGPPSASGAKSTGFMPAALFLGVSSDLATSGAVHHGWLDVTARDATSSAAGSGSGAVVVSVEAGGAAAGALVPGDVIDSVGGAPVRSMAELRTRLYVLSAGEPVTVGYRRGGTAATAEVDLASSP